VLEAKHPVLRQWLDKAKTNWVLLALVGLMAYAFLLRTLHLLKPDHYYIVNPDSYFFDRLAQGIMSGEPLGSYPGSHVAFTLHSGMAYPLAYIAMAVSSVFNMSSADALGLASKFLPSLLGVISLLVIYVAATKIFNRRVGLFSAVTWALMLTAILLGAAGFIDRDSLSILLIMTGAFLFYLSKGWHLKVANKDIGWLVGGLAVFAIEGLVYLEWDAKGAVLLPIILIAYFVVKVLFGYLGQVETEPSISRRVAAAVGQTNWHTFSLVMLGNIAVVAAIPHRAISTFKFASGLIQSGEGTGVVETQGISFPNLLVYELFLIPMALGIYVAWKKRNNGALFFSCWFLSLLVLSIFIQRVLLYATPAACVLSGIGLGLLWDRRSWERFANRVTFSGVGQQLALTTWLGWSWFQRYGGKVLVAGLLGLTLLLSTFSAFSLASLPVVAADREWQDALTYIREETPQNAIVMTQWSWGYWILDLGQRTLVVDNGYYNHTPAKDRDVALAYFTSDPSEAAKIMKTYGASYLIFSQIDLDFTKSILGWADLDKKYDSFPGTSLFRRTLCGDFQAGGGLEVVYRSVPDSEVVILRLSQE